jgi:hypothetical protein
VAATGSRHLTLGTRRSLTLSFSLFLILLFAAMAKGIFGGALRGVDAFGKVIYYPPQLAYTHRHRQWRTSKSRQILAHSVCPLSPSRGICSCIPVTLLSFAIIATFTMIEFFDYRRLTIDTSILVDRARDEKLTVRFNMTFSKVPCYRQCLIARYLIAHTTIVLSLDVMDISGEQQHDITHNVVKTRLNEFGSPVVTEGTSRPSSVQYICHC